MRAQVQRRPSVGRSVARFPSGSAHSEKHRKVPERSEKGRNGLYEKRRKADRPTAFGPGRQVSRCPPAAARSTRPRSPCLRSPWRPVGVAAAGPAARTASGSARHRRARAPFRRHPSVGRSRGSRVVPPAAKSVEKCRNGPKRPEKVRKGPERPVRKAKEGRPTAFGPGRQVSPCPPAVGRCTVSPLRPPGLPVSYRGRPVCPSGGGR